MYCWGRYAFLALVAALGLGEMIAACGQKGPLYLPKPEKTQPKAAKPAQPVSSSPQNPAGQATGTQQGAEPDAPASAKGSG
jgi:predicted small lipoprotein YifL